MKKIYLSLIISLTVQGMKHKKASLQTPANMSASLYKILSDDDITFENNFVQFAQALHVSDPYCIADIVNAQQSIKKISHMLKTMHETYSTISLICDLISTLHVGDFNPHTITFPMGALQMHYTKKINDTFIQNYITHTKNAHIDLINTACTQLNTLSAQQVLEDLTKHLRDISSITKLPIKNKNFTFKSLQAGIFNEQFQIFCKDLQMLYNKDQKLPKVLLKDNLTLLHQIAQNEFNLLYHSFYITSMTLYKKNYFKLKDSQMYTFIFDIIRKRH